MKKLVIIISFFSTILFLACNKEKQFEKILYGEWEVTSFMHGADDLTQFYKDSCGCRLVFPDMKEDYNDCVLKCPYNGWNYYFSDSLTSISWRREIFQRTSFNIVNDDSQIDWYFGNMQPDNIYRWGMYPLTIRINSTLDIQKNSFKIEEISKEELTLMFTDSINDTFVISFSKIKE